MKAFIAVATAAAALASTMPAAAAPAPVETEAAVARSDAQPAVARPAKPTRYCYDTEATGSRISKRVCQTRAEWRAEGVIVPDKL